MTTDKRILYALITAILGLAIPAFLIGFLTVKNPVITTGTRMWAASEIVAAAGLFTSIVGTLVGAFLGVEVGAAGQERAEVRAAEAEAKTLRAVALLTPEKAAEFLAH